MTKKFRHDFLDDLIEKHKKESDQEAELYIKKGMFAPPSTAYGDYLSNLPPAQEGHSFYEALRTFACVISVVLQLLIVLHLFGQI